MGWFTPKCPIETAAKNWIEQSFGWLSEKLGTEIIESLDPLLRDAPGFDFQFTDGHDYAARVYVILASHLGLPTDEITLSIRPDEEFPPSFHSAYESNEDGTRVYISESRTGDTVGLESTVAANLAMHMLHGQVTTEEQNRLSPGMLDLAAIYVGLGVFGANRMFETDPAAGMWKTRIAHPMGSREFGYALALREWYRGPQGLDISAYLRPDARVPFLQAHKFLKRTQDCLFSKPWVRVEDWPEQAITDSLENGTNGQRLAALAELMNREPHWESLRDHLVNGALDKDPDVRIGAMQCLSKVAEPGDVLIEICENNLTHHQVEVRASAAWTLRRASEIDQRVHDALARGLNDDSSVVVVHSAMAINELVPDATALIPDLLSAINSATVRCDYEIADELLKTLDSISDTPDVLIAEYFEDEELRSRVLESLTELIGSTDEAEQDSSQTGDEDSDSVDEERLD